MNQKPTSAADIADGLLPVSAATPPSNVTQALAVPHGCSLTLREQEVLKLMAFGLSNKEIASRLSVGRRTVETHIDHILRKLDVPTRTRAVSKAIRFDLLNGALTGGPPSSRDARPNNLPFQLTTLVGRAQDLANLRSSLETNRLITLSGSGGVGKTRLALHVGVDLLDNYPDGVWLCDFSPISNAEFVASVVARVLGVHQHANRPLTDSIVRALKRKQSLLVFDNCEHVRDAVAALADEILHNCPNIRILATSRQSLGIIGEVVHRLPSLAVPERDETLTADKAIDYAAIALFLDRAQVSDTGFTLTNESAPVVAEICRRLDGIPLAIELAATRVHVISVRRLAQSLDDRFKILTARSTTALSRHKTLTALIDWSYDLLTAQERELFKRLGIFAGGFSLSAATAVCSGGGVNADDILDLLSSLTDKSLVVANITGEIERYRLLESTRAYALESLGAERDSNQLSRRHAEYFRDEAVTADSHWGTGSTVACLARMELELDNYRAALEWALTNGREVRLAANLAGALQRLWLEGALAVEGRYWISRAQMALDESVQPQAAARLWLALSLLSGGKVKRDCAQRALALSEAAGDDHGTAWALVSLVFGLFQMGHFEEVTDLNTRARALMYKCENKYGVAQTLTWEATLSRYCHANIGVASESFERALDAFKALGDEIGTAKTLANYAEKEFSDGNVEQALSLVGAALETHRHGEDAASYGIKLYVCNMAAYLIALGDLDKARESALDGMELARQRQDTVQTTIALQHFALLGALSGQVPKAARLIGYVNLRYKQLAIQREFTEKWGFDKLMAELREQLNGSEIEELEAEGAEWSEDRAIDEALKI